MATKHKTSSDSKDVQPPQIRPDQGIILVKRQIEAGQKLIDGNNIDENAYRSWENTTENYLIRAFGLNHSNIEKFHSLGIVWVVTGYEDSRHWNQTYKKYIQSQLVQSASEKGNWGCFGRV